MKTQYGEVAVAREGHVAVLEISRPPNNHVSVGLMRELANALDDIDAERELRATVL
ncbi:MAG: enoyl-CoA hydratase/isomerase family protein, partial [Alphaproteobacteria bacterium]|nr:enoyl-CoA hydratase/isomerase family protein [Alphaproteobacteria bacterium]